ncbi:hypothetical protein AX15_006684 [Amanita polypyramis BW_CC]|nr:hypothetical protein AX15_006684 [Amanita polypyramis BW_CC]
MSSTIYSFWRTWERNFGFKDQIDPTPMSSPSTFYAEELNNALQEQSFGIHGFTIISSTSSLQCSASVTLLEGNTIRITLRDAGYSIENDEQGADQNTYETAEALLASASPLFRQKKHEALIKALERLQ